MEHLFTVEYFLPELTSEQIKAQQHGSIPKEVYIWLQKHSYKGSSKDSIMNELLTDLLQFRTAESQVKDSIYKLTSQYDDVRSKLFNENKIIREYEDKITHILRSPSPCHSWPDIHKMKGINRKRHCLECRSCRIRCARRYDNLYIFRDERILSEEDDKKFEHHKDNAEKLRNEMDDIARFRSNKYAMIRNEATVIKQVATTVCKLYIQTRLHLTTSPQTVIMIGETQFSMADLGQALMNLKQ